MWHNFSSSTCQSGLILCFSSGLHLGVIHSQTDAVRSLAQVLSALPGEEVLNMRNDLYQVTNTYTNKPCVSVVM